MFSGQEISRWKWNGPGTGRSQPSLSETTGPSYGGQVNLLAVS